MSNRGEGDRGTGGGTGGSNRGEGVRGTGGQMGQIGGRERGDGGTGGSNRGEGDRGTGGGQWGKIGGTCERDRWGIVGEEWEEGTEKLSSCQIYSTLKCKRIGLALISHSRYS